MRAEPSGSGFPLSRLAGTGCPGGDQYSRSSGEDSHGLHCLYAAGCGTSEVDDRDALEHVLPRPRQAYGSEVLRPVLRRGSRPNPGHGLIRRPHGARQSLMRCEVSGAQQYILRCAR